MLARLRRIYSHPLFIPVICLTLAVLLILFAGPYIALAGYVPLASWVTRLLLSAGVIIGYALYKYIQHLKSQQQQDKLVAQISAEDNTNQAIDAESTALRKKFIAAFDVLKNTKGGPPSLTKIPWYMIIGSPGAGKTTLLSNSGLSFPLADKLGNKSLSGVGGTKNCDWWITQDAVLLDTAGRYASQDSFQKVDESGWKNFLALIKRFRKKPISGLIVSISMTDIINLNEYELSQQTTQVKQRIAEVNDYFSTRFPVYIVITKTDMLAGFSQFFETFSHKEREQTFGFTFDPAISTGNHCSKHFNQQFSALCNAITRRQWDRLALERDSGRKSQLYAFGEQLSSLENPLSHIIRQLGDTDDRMSTGIIRGLYFTSGVQTGAPIDRMQARISRIVGMHATQKPIWNNDQRSYFIKELLQQVVFAEADRFGTQAGHERKKKHIKQYSLAAFTVISVLICAGLLTSFNNNTKYLEQADASVEHWLAEYQLNQQSATQQRSLPGQLPAINQFLSTINGLKDTQQRHFSGMGLDQGNALQHALKASYQRLLKAVLQPYVHQQLERLLTAETTPAQQYQALKTYLMLGDEGKLRKNDYIKQFLATILNNHKRFTATQYAQLLTHVDYLVDNNIRLDTLNGQLITDARRTLRAQPLGEIYYRELKERSSNAFDYLSMAQLGGSSWHTLFTTSRDDIETISAMFTPAQFDQIMTRGITGYLDELADEAWVLGRENTLDSTTTAKQLRKLYTQDYVNSWQHLIDSISVNTTSDAASLVPRLQAAAQSDSPFFILLNSIARATELTSRQVESDLAFAQSANEKLSTARDLLGHEEEKRYVTSRFSALHEAMKEQRRAATEQQFRSLLQDIIVKLNFQLQNTRPDSQPIALNALQGFSYSQTPPLNRWADELVGIIANTQHRLSRQQWNTQWQNQWVPVCESIVQHKYPFQPHADTDASQSDLVQLFANNGGLLAFFNQHLAPLINTQSTPWAWLDDVQAEYQFSHQVLPFFESAFAIQHALFKSGGSELSARFTITPVYLDPRLARLHMSVHGASINYQFGRPTPTTIIWPPAGSELSSINFIRRDGSEIQTTERGLFAFARLLDSGQAESPNGTKLAVTFNLNTYKAIIEVDAAGHNNPAIFDELSRFQCLAGL